MQMKKGGLDFFSPGDEMAMKNIKLLQGISFILHVHGERLQTDEFLCIFSIRPNSYIIYIGTIINSTSFEEYM
jgi:hypothetical protein